jgi:cellulose synthase/poly-beta-1,6-N-acetylglucosamine synthase-like glycosyltransferase
MAMKALFWIAAGIVVYVYAGYPGLLALWARLRPAVPRAAQPGRSLPSVSIVLAARNEGRRLGVRIDNLLALDYPTHLREIVVVSDGSTDETPEVLLRFGSSVRAVFLPPTGKAGALNAGVAASRHEILVFADARQHFAADALRHLVAPFEDARVGAVSGELMIDEGPARTAEPESPVSEGIGVYWRYEKWLRQRESEIGSTLGATGAIWALRRTAWRPLPAQTLLDDVLAPMRAVLDGHRVVFAPAARAYDRSSPDASTERRRKVRTLAGNYQLLRLEPRLLVPFVNPVWLQFVSHKIGRLVVPYALVALLIASAALASTSAVYGAALTLQVAFYVLAAHGAVIALARDAVRPQAQKEADPRDASPWHRRWPASTAVKE